MKQSDDQNTVITDDGVKHIAIDAPNPETCDGCQMQNYSFGETCSYISCASQVRDDKRDVIFVTPV